MKTALVTGAAGFLGSHLCEHLVSRGFAVIAVDNFSTGQKDNQKFLLSLGESMRFFEADVVQPWSSWFEKLPESWRKNLKYVFHFASPASPSHYQKLSLETLWANSIGLSNGIALANSVGAKVIFASTSEVYGDPQVSPQPESYWGNVNPYGARSCYDEAKRFGEALIYSENKRYGTSHGVVRIFNTYGPRMRPDDGRVVINFIYQAMRGEALTIYGDGTQRRSFCYVSDLIQGVLGCAEKNISEPLNLGNDQEFQILDLAQLVRKIVTANKIPFQYLPPVQDDPQQRKPDLARALRLLAPWKPEVSLEEGLAHMVKWIQECKSNGP